MVLPALRYRQVGTGLTSTKYATTEATAAATAEVHVSKAKADNAKKSLRIHRRLLLSDDEQQEEIMAAKLRIATFNLENLDDEGGEGLFSLQQRIEVMRPQLMRLQADILCLQEVHSQEDGGERTLSALEQLLEETPYADYQRATTHVEGGSQYYAERNLVILSRHEIREHHQYKHDYAPPPAYRLVTAEPPENQAENLTWERPILHAQIALSDEGTLNVLNLHLKSKLPSNVPGQKKDLYTWKSASGWAEGFFLSSMMRVGQALETRMLIDRIFDEDEAALIVACGDFNADLDDVPVQAIRGDVESTGNGELAWRVMVPCENSVPESARYSLLYLGKGEMIDHVLMSRSLLGHYRHSEVHNELLHDESIAFATDVKYPESDHAPVVAGFELPDG
jgi:endonuclease/exonuclease/phosphatase family metal-dependent hydrolase